jgi:hypothetical protein
MSVQRRQRGQPMSWSAALWRPRLPERKPQLPCITPIALRFTWPGSLIGRKRLRKRRVKHHPTPRRQNSTTAWMQRARNHAEKLCGCFPASGKVRESAPRIAEWAERWPHDYLEAESRAEESMKKIQIAIEAIERRRQIEKSGNSG